MRIALVKQDVYQDLYVGDKNFTPGDLLFSSMCRVGPIGLFTIFHSDFYIIKEEKDKECKIWTKVIPFTKEKFRRLKNESIDKIEGYEFFSPGSDKCNGFYSVDCNSINWNNYDVVISINCSIPYRIIKNHTNILWAYMIGEANILSEKVYFGYDISLNQEIRGIVGGINKVVDFPYTFVGGNCLESIIYKQLKRASEKDSIYAEINCVDERPVKNVPQIERVCKKVNLKLKLHHQNIYKNLVRIYDSKYYLKIGGRKTRGNGAIEAISLGTLVLMSPKDITYSQVLPKEAWVFSEGDAIEKINYLNSNKEEYVKLLNKERELVNQFIINYPMYSLEVALQQKRDLQRPNKYISYNNLHFFIYAFKKVREKGVKKIFNFMKNGW